MCKNHFLLKVVLAVFLLSSAGFLGYAIEQYGILSGTVVDESGGGLPGVEVKVEGPAMMGSKTTITNYTGFYRFGQMRVGSKYIVTFVLKGFKENVQKDVRIELAKETVVPVMLTMGVITERVVVTGEVPIVDPKSSTNQVNISKEMVETLANDRQYQSIMEMMPGSIPGNNPAMMGAADSDNMYQFDGMESTDPLTKTWSTAMNFDNFEEMQVVAQGAPAEYGRGTGAVINVVTKSGSNKLHGTARLSISKSDWNTQPNEENTSFSDATHYLDETRPSLNLGGPIIKDHIWFFGSWERRNKWKPATWYTSPAEALASSPSGEGKGYYQGHYASAKATMRFGNFTLMGMWSEDPIKIPDYYKYTNSPNHANENEMAQNQGGWNFNSEVTTTLGANTYLVARFSMKRNELNLLANTMTGPRYEQSGYYWGSGYYDYRTGRDHNQYMINLNHFMDTGFGYHDLKMGFEYYDMNVASAINYAYPGGEYIRYNQYGQTYVRYVFETDVPKQVMKYGDNITLFVQDKWEVSKGLTLNLGVRFENTSYKNHANQEVLKFDFMDMFAPRLGVAYAFGDNKFHANWGKYYDIYSWHLVNNLQPNDFVRTYDYYRGEHYGYSDWTYIRSYYWTAPSSDVEVADNLKPQYMEEMGIGYERILGKKFSLGISYMHRAWKQKIEDYDVNGDGIYEFAMENDYRDQNESWGKTYKKYDAVILTLKKNLGDDKFQFMASYTWSKLRGFGGADTETGWGDNPYTYVGALGYLPNDTRHQIRFQGNVILPWDINVGLKMYWFSGDPYTDYVDMLWEDGGATGHDGYYYDYLIDGRGGSGRYPPTSRVDLRLEKKFKIKKLFSISIYADIFNLFNQQNAIDRNEYIGEGYLTGPVGSNDYVLTYESGSYGNLIEWFAPRSYFFGAKIEW